MAFEQTQLNALSKKVASTLGKQLLEYSPEQAILFEQAMGRILKRHKGDAALVTPQEILGAQDLVLDHLLPIDLQRLQENS